MNEDTALEAAEVAANLLTVEKQIKELETQKTTMRDQLKSLLPPFEKGWKSVYGPAEVAWVAARVTHTADTDGIKKKLALAGVALDLLERTWDECTTEKIGAPTIRVTAATEGEKP